MRIVCAIVVALVFATPAAADIGIVTVTDKVRSGADRVVAAVSFSGRRL